MKTLILGLGISGRSALKYLLNEGHDVICVDKNARTLSQDPAYQLIKIYSEEDDLSLDDVGRIIKSPGISWEHKVLKQAIEKQIPLSSEIELGLEALKKKNKTLFAITGSNGKTTTTLLTTHLLQQAGLKAQAVGNIGRPLLSEIESDHDFFVVELSSFQLETLSIPLFDAGCILNITPNHLDRYPSFHEYAKTKFGLQHCLKKEGKLYLTPKLFKEFEKMIREESKEKVATILPLSYRGGPHAVAAHDLENLAASLALVAHAGVKVGNVDEAFSTFVKPPHRIEFVRFYRGVGYINDSKATSCDAVQKALEAMQTKVVLIAGGLDKKGDFKSLAPILKEKVSKVLLIGSSAAKINQELQECVSVEMVETLECAVKRAQILGKEGESVLFSPGCASYDQFRNYEHRGEVFKQLVNELGEGGK